MCCDQKIFKGGKYWFQLGHESIYISYIGVVGKPVYISEYHNLLIAQISNMDTQTTFPHGRVLIFILFLDMEILTNIS